MKLTPQKLVALLSFAAVISPSTHASLTDSSDNIISQFSPEAVTTLEQLYQSGVIRINESTGQLEFDEQFMEILEEDGVFEKIFNASSTVCRDSY